MSIVVGEIETSSHVTDRLGTTSPLAFPTGFALYIAGAVALDLGSIARSRHYHTCGINRCVTRAIVSIAFKVAAKRSLFVNEAVNQNRNKQRIAFGKAWKRRNC
jgi:hypothetical protein